MKQKTIALIALILIVNLSYGQTQLIEADLVKINNMPLASSLDSLVMINSTNKLTYLPKSSLVTPPQTLSFSAGQLTISDANTIDLDTYYYSESEVDATFLPFTGGALSGGLVIDENATTTNIAESVLTVKKESTLNSTNVGQFIDVNRLASSTPLDLSSNTIGLVSKVTNNSLFNDSGIVGGNFIGRHSGVNDFNFNYGSLNTAEYDGSGNGNFLVGSSVRSSLIGTGVGVVDYTRGMSSTALINNPNATVNFLQGYHNTIDLSQGTVGSATVSYLDLDGTGATVTGDLAYIRAGNDALPTVNGNSYFIKSETTLPSEFAGDITAPNFIGSGSQLTGVAKTNVDNNFSAGQTSMDYITTYNGTGFSYISSDRDAGSSRYRAQMNTSSGLAFFTLYNVTTATTLGQLKMSFEDIKYNDNLIYHAGNLDLSNYIEKAAFYEEGTFTPTLTDLGGGATYSVGVTTANYIREGNKVFFSLKFANINTTGTPSGSIRVTGMPFNYAYGVESFNVTEKNSDKPQVFIVGLPTGSNEIAFNRKTSSSTNYDSYSSVTYTSGEVTVTGTYITNVYTP